MVRRSLPYISPVRRHATRACSGAPHKFSSMLILVSLDMAGRNALWVSIPVSDVEGMQRLALVIV